MKVWRFYLKDDENGIRSKYDLYAITHNKKYAKRFMEERDMDKFIMKCSKEPKEDYVKFVNNNMSILLDMYEFDTKIIDEEKKYRVVQQKVLATEYEHQSCDSDMILGDILADGDWDVAPDYTIYKKKIINSLRKLEYIRTFKLYKSDYYSVIDPCDDDYSAPELWVDELGIFLRIFGRTFK